MGKCVAIFSFLLVSVSLLAQRRQERELQAADRDARNAVPFPISLFLPSGISLGYEMRAYIRSDEFGAFDSSSRPEDVLDEIYNESLELGNGDLSTALFAAAFGTFEHEFIPLTFFGSELDLPLTSEDHAHFERRISHLPEHLYHIPEGDRDKLQHFFSSAWLKSIVGMDWLVNLAGNGVELGESLFVVGGSKDPRDVHANADGRNFEIQAECSPQFSPATSLTPNP